MNCFISPKSFKFYPNEAFVVLDPYYFYLNKLKKWRVVEWKFFWASALVVDKLLYFCWAEIHWFMPSVLANQNPSLLNALVCNCRNKWNARKMVFFFEAVSIRNSDWKSWSYMVFSSSSSFSFCLFVYFSPENKRKLQVPRKFISCKNRQSRELLEQCHTRCSTCWPKACELDDCYDVNSSAAGPVANEGIGTQTESQISI